MAGTTLGDNTSGFAAAGTVMSNPAIVNAVGNLVTWTHRGEWVDQWQSVHDSHFECLSEIAGIVGTSGNPLAGVDRRSLATLEVFILDDFFCSRFGEDRRNVIDDFLKRRGWRESPVARRYLRVLRDSVHPSTRSSMSCGVRTCRCATSFVAAKR